MIRTQKLLLSLLFLLISSSLFAAGIDATTINNFRVLSAAGNTKIVLDYSSNNSKVVNKAKLKYKNFTLDNPSRLVLDLPGAKFQVKNFNYNHFNWTSTPISNVRYSDLNKNLRLVFDLNKKIKYKVIASNLSLTIDINHEIINHETITKVKTPEVVKLLKSRKSDNVNKATIKELPKATSSDLYDESYKKFVVVLDPGHGGDDSGAVGPFGSQEKDVVLQIAKYLKQYLDEDRNLKAVLTRDGDYFLNLRKRTSKARIHQADLFISIHADGFKDPKAHGSSVFVLSERGASSELAKWIADHENAADLVGGVSLDNKDQMLATVLLDLSQTASNRSSMQVANYVLEQIGSMADLHKNNVERAGFVVLKSPDIPSILIETGFISNPEGERNLRSPTYQRRLAYAIYKGVQKYFQAQPKSVIPNWSNKLLQARRN